MIRNNLAILLAKKQIKISRMAFDTGLSRTTLTALSQNESKRIDNDTLNIILMYLKIMPNDFFNFISFDFQIEIIPNEFDIEIVEYPKYGDLSEDIKIKKATFDLYMKIEDKVSLRAPMYEFEISIDNQYSAIHYETDSNTGDFGNLEENEIIEGSLLFNIVGPEQNIRQFKDFADKEIPVEFQEELTKRLISSFNIVVENEIKKKYPDLLQKYVEVILSRIDLISSDSMLTFLPF